MPLFTSVDGTKHEVTSLYVGVDGTRMGIDHIPVGIDGTMYQVKIGTQGAVITLVWENPNDLSFSDNVTTVVIDGITYSVYGPDGSSEVVSVSPGTEITVNLVSVGGDQSTSLVINEIETASTKSTATRIVQINGDAEILLSVSATESGADQDVRITGDAVDITPEDPEEGEGTE